MKASDLQPLTLLELLCGVGGYPTPEYEYCFHAKRRWRFDVAFVAAKIAIEVEGGAFTQGRHVRGKGYLGDMEKYTEAAIAGWIVIRITPQQAHLLAGFLKRAFEARAMQAA